MMRRSGDLSLLPLRGVDRAARAKLRVISYNVLARCHTSAVLQEQGEGLSPLSLWPQRRIRLIHEIMSYAADVVCLQDVDEFSQWWEPELGRRGYDCVYKKRTDSLAENPEGVAVFWNRRVFRLCRSEELEMNAFGHREDDAALASRASVSDNVAVLAHLRPLGESEAGTAICVASAQLCDEKGEHGDGIRMLQVKGLFRFIEYFCGDFSIPVVVCGTFNCLPASAPYEAMRRGAAPLDPGPPDAPKPPQAAPVSATIMRLTWYPPVKRPWDPHNLGYVMSWCAGCNRQLGFQDEMYFRTMSVATYTVETTETGHRTIENPWFEACIAGLASGIAYEFRVAAVNERGQGAWSEIPGNEPEGRLLLPAEVSKRVRQRQKRETLQLEKILLADPRKRQMKQYIPVPALHCAVELEEQKYKYASLSGSTPRFENGELNVSQTTFRRPKAPDDGLGTDDEDAPLGGRPTMLCHRSVYDEYSCGGEPLFTTSTSDCTATVDYILVSCESLIPLRVLRLPGLDDLRKCDNARELAPDRESNKPSGWVDDLSSTDNYMGEWAPYVEDSFASRTSHNLPNSKYASSHLLLFVELDVESQNCRSSWGQTENR